MRFAYAGNRAFVLRRMIALRLDVVSVHAVSGSYLEKWLQDRSLAYSPIGARADLTEALRRQEFDVFISCGCPVILPVERLQQEKARHFVNIHPSLLPDLRGVDPVPGALLFGRPAGVTCHVMDDGVDTGPVISRIAIPYGDDVDAELLYQMTFDAEVRAFEAALARRFAVDASLPVLPTTTESAYYTYRSRDAVLRPGDDLEQAWRRLRAFCTPSKGVTACFPTVRRFARSEARLSGMPILTRCMRHAQTRRSSRYGAARL